jgi:diphthamide biosynthesis enzyme Dph1/Dph2-like protein
MNYDLELNRIAAEIERLADDTRPTTNAKPLKVCLQFPDGLKANATAAVKELERLTTNDKRQTAFYIWAGSNFGGCDYPWYLKDLGFDLLVNFGHSVFRKWS